MATTYRSFVDMLEALSITGVSRQYTQGPPLGPPDVGDCPFQYVRYPSGEDVTIVFGKPIGFPTMRAELVVCVEPVAQDTAYANFDATVDMMDNVLTTLRESACVRNVSIRQIIDTVAGQQYWAVLATVERVN